MEVGCTFNPSNFLDASQRASFCRSLTAKGTQLSPTLGVTRAKQEWKIMWSEQMCRQLSQFLSQLRKEKKKQRNKEKERKEKRIDKY